MLAVLAINASVEYLLDSDMFPYIKLPRRVLTGNMWYLDNLVRIVLHFMQC
jgi:hypothetical protein